jgi:hypothetical protein
VVVVVMVDDDDDGTADDGNFISRPWFTIPNLVSMTTTTQDTPRLEAALNLANKWLGIVAASVTLCLQDIRSQCRDRWVRRRAKCAELSAHGQALHAILGSAQRLLRHFVVIARHTEPQQEQPQRMPTLCQCSVHLATVRALFTSVATNIGGQTAVAMSVEFILCARKM